jgi:hypothetical protein
VIVRMWENMLEYGRVVTSRVDLSCESFELGGIFIKFKV